MSKPQFTYRIFAILTSVLVWEILFWALVAFLFVILGYFNNGIGEQLAFKNPEYFWCLVVVLPLAWLYYFSLKRSNNLFNKTGKNIRAQMFSPVSSGRIFFRYFLFRNALVFLIFAMAQPVFGSKKIKGTVESMELVLCLDISNSMNVCDIEQTTSRLEIAKRAISELINNLHGEKIGVCVFANSAFTQLPMTLDYNAAKMYVKDIESNMLSSQGTNISAALQTSLSMFSEDKESSKGIILVTDGENHEENPDVVLTEIKESKIQLIMLGLGTKNGGLVPKNPNRPELGYKTSSNGTTILSKMNPRFINEIAYKGGGFATISSDPFPNLTGLLKQINRLKKTQMESMEFDVKENRYQIPLFAAITFWLMYLLLSSKIFTSFDKFATEK